MEPSVGDESGTAATLGRYFEFGGWSLGTDHIDFLDEHVRTGGDCAGEPSVVRWSVNGSERIGDPAAYKLYDGDVIAVASSRTRAGSTGSGRRPRSGAWGSRADDDHGRAHLTGSRVTTR